jgi:hypothetical protein
MSFFRKYKPYRRGDHINIIRTREDDPNNNNNFPAGCPHCAHCAIALHYDEKRDVFWCLHCGWNRPTDFDTSSPAPSSSSTTTTTPKLESHILNRI